VRDQDRIRLRPSQLGLEKSRNVERVKEGRGVARGSAKKRKKGRAGRFLLGTREENCRKSHRPYARRKGGAFRQTDRNKRRGRQHAVSKNGSTCPEKGCGGPSYRKEGNSDSAVLPMRGKRKGAAHEQLERPGAATSSRKKRGKAWRKEGRKLFHEEKGKVRKIPRIALEEEGGLRCCLEKNDIYSKGCP